MSDVRIVLEPVAVTRADAARALGISLDSFERFCQPDLRMIRKGRLRLVPVAELRRWVELNSEHLLGGGA